MNKVLGPNTVVINRLHPDSGQHKEKVVNIELLKSDVVVADVLPDPEDVETEGDADAKDEPIPDQGYSLRDGSGIYPLQEIDVIRRRGERE